MANERYIFFDEPTHSRVDQYGNKYIAVSTCVERVAIPFDKDYHAKRKAIELKTSDTAIKQQWTNINKHSVNNGNKKHGVLECAIKDTSKFAKAVKILTTNGIYRMFTIYDLDSNSDVGEMSINDFYKKIGYKYPLIYDTIKYYVEKGYKIFSEITVYDDDNLIAGCIDVLLVKDNLFVIIDWKTNRNTIEFESGYYRKDKITNELTNIWVPKQEFMKYPVDNLPECIGNHYKLQLSLYANIVELFGYYCTAIILFHIRDSFILNEYGMPKKDKNGIYIKDESGVENVNYHVIPYIKNEVTKLREYIGKDARVLTQQKLIM